MTDLAPINPAIGELFRQYRKKKLNPGTGKGWTLHELSAEISALIQKSDPDSPEEGLSASAISRLENGSLLPGRTKLRLMADFLEIPEPELKPLIDLGDHKIVARSADFHEQNRMREFESKLQKTPFDWLQLLSASNMAGFYHNSLGWAEDGLLVLESPQMPPALQAVMRALIQSKKAYAQFCLAPESEAPLQRALDWARHAEQALPLLAPDSVSDWERAWLQIETVRAMTTASLELFDQRFLKHPHFNAQEELEQRYSELQTIFKRFRQSLSLEQLVATGEQQQHLTALYLYLMREQDRLGFKWLEAMEMQLFWQDPTVQTVMGPQPPRSLEALALGFYERLCQAPEQTVVQLQAFYQHDRSGQLIFTPARGLQVQWRALGQSMLNTLDQHDRLHEPQPNKAWQEAVMLYPLTAARLGQFDRFIDLGYLKLLYMQTTAQTRPLWHYIRACCYALSYRSSGKPEQLETSLENWFHYCYGEADGHCNLEHFSHCLREVALWSSWFPLVTALNPSTHTRYQRWFVETLQRLLARPRFKQLLFSP